MSWRIRTIGIYSHAGTLREVHLEPKGLNVITGAPAKGKSTILDIVDYCLLSRACPIARGVVRSRVASVAILLECDGSRFAIARRLPGVGQQASSAVAVEFGPDVVLWSSEPDFGWSLEMAREELAGFTRIEAIPLLRGYDGDPTKRHPVGIRHCIPYLFQPQDVIASRNVTFPSLDDTWRRNHAIDALPYFLGLVSGQHTLDRQRLRQLQTERNQVVRELETATRAEANANAQFVDLFNEAVAFGLTGRDDVSTVSEMHKRLRVVASWPQEVDAGRRAQGDPGDALDDARGIENQLSRKVADLRARLADIGSALQAAETYRDVRGKQLGRLRIGELLPKELSVGACPLCGNGTLDAGELQTQLALTEESLAAMDGHNDRRLMSRLEQEKVQHEEDLSNLQRDLKAAQRAVVIGQAATQQRRDQQEYERRRWHLVGRIAAVESLRSAPIDPLRERLESLDREIGDLRQRVSEGAIRKALDRTEEEIAARMTALAQRLGVEFPDARCRLRLSELRIEVELDEDFSPLSELGSGANWVGYHVAASLALHEYLGEVGSPVPRVIVLDQLSQAWFPQVRGPWQRSAIPKNDKDLQAVRQVFEVLHKCAKEPRAPQIVAIDHADFDEPWFKSSTQENWHGDEGLVPSDWPSAG